MRAIAVDWDEDGLAWSDGKATGSAMSLDDLVRSLHAPTAIICWTIFCGLRAAERESLRKMLAERSHVLAPVSARALAVLGDAAGETTDGCTVARLASIVTAGAMRVSRELVGRHDRGDVAAALDVIHSLAAVEDGLPVLVGAREVLGSYATLPESKRAILGDGRTYRADLLAAIALASLAWNRADFERIMGLSDRGRYGAIPHAVRGWYAVRNATSAAAGAPTTTWTEYRHVLRWAFMRIKSARA